MTNVLMSLGDFQFEIARNAFSELQKSRSYRWVDVETLSLTHLQYTGRGAQSITLTGSLHPTYLGEDGMNYMERLTELADSASPPLLISASGENFGRYAILRIDEDQSQFTAAGIPRKIEFKIEIREYHELPKPTPQKNKAKAATKAKK